MPGFHPEETMDLPDFLTRDDPASIRLAGHRIGLAHLLHWYNEGYSPEMLWSEYPDIPLPLIYKVIAFYLEKQAEIDAYLAECQAEIDKQRQRTPSGPTVAEMRQRLQAVRPAKGA
jgi:uncharacterized protein (DUF433 family)